MSTTDIHPTLSLAEIIRVNVASMLEALPPCVPDTPENRWARDEFARGAFASLNPNDALEVMLACQIVLLNAHAATCLSEVARPGLDPRFRRRSRAQARSMMRLMRDALRDLQEHQVRRADAAAERLLAAPVPPAPTTRPPEPAPVPRSEADARRQRAARIRELDLRVIETPDTRH
jgi:hypothetical protein